MNIFGTRNDDVLTATSPDDVLFGREGNDWLISRELLASLVGGNGDDFLFHRFVSSNLQLPALIGGDYNADNGGGGDRIRADIVLDGLPEGGNEVDDVVIDLSARGGRGDTRIDFRNSADLFNDNVDISPNVTFRSNIVDVAGDNRVSINNRGFTNDGLLSVENTVRLGGGDDRFNYSGNYDANNNAPTAEHDIQMGNGANSIRFSESMGFGNYRFTGGRDEDQFVIRLFSEEGNDNGIGHDIFIDTRNGDDRVVLEIIDGSDIDGAGLEGTIRLGGGDNTLRLDTFRGGDFDITAQGGADRIDIKAGPNFSDDFVDPFYTINAGGGANRISLDLSGFDEFFSPEKASGYDITTGNGNDRISVDGEEALFVSSGVPTRQIETGGGRDVVDLGLAASATVSLGSGADKLFTSIGAFASPDDAVATLEITDFSLDDGDRFFFRDFDFGVAALSNGAFQAQSDFDALAESDALVFAERSGNDLAFRVEDAGVLAEIIMRDLTDVDLSAFDPVEVLV